MMLNVRSATKKSALLVLLLTLSPVRTPAVRLIVQLLLQIPTQVVNSSVCLRMMMVSFTDAAPVNQLSLVQGTTHQALLVILAPPTASTVRTPAHVLCASLATTKHEMDLVPSAAWLTAVNVQAKTLAKSVTKECSETPMDHVSLVINIAKIASVLIGLTVSPVREAS